MADKININEMWLKVSLRNISQHFKKEKAPVGTVPYIEIGNVDVEGE